MSVYVQSFGGRISVVTSNEENEKSSFGKETVPAVACSSSARLNGTTVEGNVDAGGSVTATNANVRGKIAAGGSITATNSQANNLHAGGSITAVNSSVSNEVEAGGSATANRCERLGSVKAGGAVTLDDCPNVRSVFSNNMVTLRETVVQGSVSAGADATVQFSKVCGALICASNRLIIEGSEIDTIELRCSGGGSVRSGGISTSVVSVGGNLFVGAGSIVSINTGVNVFVNGALSSQFQATSAKEKSSENKTPPSEPAPKPRQTLELRNSKVRNVTFEGGNGEVILVGEESNLSGSITGGKITTPA